MRTKFCVAAFLLTTTTLSQGCLTAAQAQGSNGRPTAPVQNKFANTAGQYDNSDLPHVKPYNARRKIQIVNENPEWTNCLPTPTMRPNLDGMQVPMAMPTGGSGGSGGAGSGIPAGLYPAGTFPPGVMFGNPDLNSNRDNLPQSRFGPSNINPAALRPQPLLPDGRTTGIHGRLTGAVPVQAGPGTIRIGHPISSAPKNADANKPVLMYQRPTTIASNGGASARTRLTGVLLQKQK